jgi:Mrp family chromosome partitioning ATPase
VSAVTEASQSKSRVAAELGLALAEPRHPRILLLEANFQWPTLHQTLDLAMPRGAGFSQQLRSRPVGRPDTPWTVLECGPTLHVLAEGMMRSPDLLLSAQFEDGLRSFRAYYDFILLDGPLASMAADSRAFSALIDGIVLVVPESGSDEIASALALFPDKPFSTIVGV